MTNDIQKLAEELADAQRAVRSLEFANIARDNWEDERKSRAEAMIASELALQRLADAKLRFEAAISLKRAEDASSC